ncbi:hypothetical protein ACHWQZ_G005564 [Mnemiopsis leidyi]
MSKPFNLLRVLHFFSLISFLDCARTNSTTLVGTEQIQLPESTIDQSDSLKGPLIALPPKRTVQSYQQSDESIVGPTHSSEFEAIRSSAEVESTEAPVKRVNEVAVEVNEFKDVKTNRNIATEKSAEVTETKDIEATESRKKDATKEAVDVTESKDVEATETSDTKTTEEAVKVTDSQNDKATDVKITEESDEESTEDAQVTKSKDIEFTEAQNKEATLEIIVVTDVEATDSSKSKAEKESEKVTDSKNVEATEVPEREATEKGVKVTESMDQAGTDAVENKATGVIESKIVKATEVPEKQVPEEAVTESKDVEGTEAPENVANEKANEVTESKEKEEIEGVITESDVVEATEAPVYDDVVEATEAPVYDATKEVVTESKDVEAIKASVNAATEKIVSQSKVVEATQPIEKEETEGVVTVSDDVEATEAPVYEATEKVVTESKDGEANEAPEEVSNEEAEDVTESKKVEATEPPEKEATEKAFTDAKDVEETESPENEATNKTAEVTKFKDIEITEAPVYEATEKVVTESENIEDTVAPENEATAKGAEVTIYKEVEATEAPEEEATEEFVTESKDVETAKAPEKEVTESQDVEDTEAPKNEATVKAAEVTKSSDVEATEPSEKRATGEVDEVTKSKKVEATEAPEKEATEEIATESKDVEAIEAPGNGATEKMVTDSKDVEDNDASENESTEKAVEVTKSEDVQATEAPGKEATEEAVSESINAETTVAPEKEVTEKTAEVTESNEVEVTEAPENESTEKAVEITKSEDVKATEAPENEATEKAAEVTKSKDIETTKEAAEVTKSKDVEATEAPENKGTQKAAEVTESKEVEATEAPEKEATEKAAEVTEPEDVEATEEPEKEATEEVVTESKDAEATEVPENEATEKAAEVTKSKDIETTKEAAEGTQSKDVEATEAPEKRGTEKDVEVTKSKEVEATEAPENEATDKVVTESKDVETAEAPEKEATEEVFTETKGVEPTEGPEKEASKKVLTEYKDVEATEAPEKKDTEEFVTESKDVKTTDAPVNEAIKEVATESKDIEATGAQVIQATKEVVTESLDVEATEAPVNEATEKIVTDSKNIEATDAPVNEATEEVFNESKDVEATETPDNEATEKAAEVTKSKNVEATDAAENETTEETTFTESKGIQATKELEKAVTEEVFTESKKIETTKAPENNATEKGVEVTKSKDVAVTDEATEEASNESKDVEATDAPVNKATSLTAEVTESVDVEATENSIDEETEKAVTKSKDIEVTEAKENETTEKAAEVTKSNNIEATKQSPEEETTTERPNTEASGLTTDSSNVVIYMNMTTVGTGGTAATESTTETTLYCGSDECALAVCAGSKCWCELGSSLIPGTTRDSSSPLKCEYLYKSTECLREQERLSFVRCDDFGQYQPSQCHPQGYCFCVTPFGEEVPETRSFYEASCSFLNIPEIQDDGSSTALCLKVQSRQLSIYTTNRYVAQCDDQGRYVKEQCDGEECWCVDHLGARLQDSIHPRWADPPRQPCDSRLLETGCPSPMVWREGANICPATCQEPAPESPECEGQVTRCACPLSLPILHNGTCVSLHDCRVKLTEEECGSMVWEECGCQQSCATRHDNCSTCTPSCVCPPDTPYLHHGFCVAEGDCPTITAADCVNGTVYTECADGCPATCTDPFPSCSSECEEGCQCPSHSPLLHNGHCIPAEQCPQEDLTPCQRSRNAVLFGDYRSTLPTRCAEDGSYLPLQCSWDECWCVTPLGTRVATVPYSLDDSVCHEIDYKVGSECNTTHCWCTDRRGERVQHTTRLIHAEISCRESDVDKSVVMATKCELQRDNMCSWVDPVLAVLSPVNSCLASSCTKQGYYQSVQCDSSRCWCVDKSGDQILGTTRHRLAGLQCSSEGVATTRCDRLQNQGVTVTCNNLGVPETRVCDETSCWCVSTAGDEIPGTRGDLNVTCPERTGACSMEREQGMNSLNIWGLPLLGPLYPLCDVWGDFRSKQCDGGACFCVDSVSGEKVDDITCLVNSDTILYSSYYGENIRVDSAKEQPSSPCFSQQEQVTLTLADRHIQISLPLCSEDGQYFPQQFQTDLGDWWCVDSQSGQQLEEQSGPRHTLPCSGAGLGQVLFNSVKMPGCVSDEIARLLDENTASSLQCEDYKYTPVQCLSEEGSKCFCVTTDTGISLSSSFSHRAKLSCPDMEETSCFWKRYSSCKDGSSPLLLSSCPDLTPVCNPDTGDFLPLQCNNNTCYCVNIETGQEIPYSHGQAGGFNCSEYGRMIDDTRSPCQKQADRRCDAIYHDTPETEGCHVLVCEGELYQAKQCAGDECYCADPQTGDPVEYADIGRSDFSCGSNGQVLYSNLTECQLEELQLCPSHYYPQFDSYLRPLSCPLPHCNPDGTYYTQRCIGDVCSCVDRETSAGIPDTVHTHGEQICDDEGNLVEDTRGHCEIERSKYCEPQNLDGIIVVPPDCPALHCLYSGLYNPLQCNVSLSECYCVDVNTGVEYPGTRSQGMGTFDCDYAGNVFSIVEGNGQRCGQQTELDCDEEGEWFIREQCTSEYCYCVYLDSGEVIVGSQQVVGLPECPALIDLRTKCQVEQDRTCVKVFQGGQLVGECGESRCATDGSFLSQYCDQEEQCWCVDRESGEKVPDSEFLSGTHYCSETSQRVFLPPCLRQNVLLCTESGLYANMQCDQDSCYCVYSDTGDRVSGYSDVLNGVECATRNDTRGPCQKASDKICVDDEEDCSVLSCDEEGMYLALQCLRGDVCFCVDHQSGDLISTAQRVTSDVVCSDLGELVGTSLCSEQSVLECDEDGQFALSQCHNNGTCFCVFGEGDDGGCLEDSRTHCERRRDVTCKEETEECPISCDNEGKYGQFDCKDSFSGSRCVGDGFFKPHHCTDNICYCVDIKTGSAIASTLRQDEDFYCSLSGEILERTLCQEQTIYSCDNNGYFLPVQQVEERYECVYIDSGAPNFYDFECKPAYDMRSVCQKVRDERCPHINQGTSYVPDTDCETVQCDPDTGLFLPKQCLQGSCYCVEVNSGVLGGRPESPEVEFYCENSGELVVLTPCRKQDILECGENGEFAAQQVDQGVHFCVFSDSGETIQDTKSTTDDLECSVLEDDRTDCQKERDDICPTQLTDSGLYSRPDDCTALVCDVSTGKYSTKQCTERACFCVDPNSGTATSDSAPDHTFVCDEDGVMVLLTPCQKQDILACGKEGEFLPKQCLSEEGPCYCVYSDTGVLVHNSDVTTGECDQLLDQRTTCQLILDEECPAKLKSDQYIRPSDCSALPCTEDGEFPTMHCIGNACYCVDIETGLLIDDTRGPRDAFICSREGERLRLTPCRRQSTYSCDSRGYFHAVQCDPSGVCVCVFVDSGFIRQGVEWCDSRFDNRTDCQKERAAGCGNLSDCFVPECDFHGNYEREQCRGVDCQCSDPFTGEPTNDIKFRPGSHWCDDSGSPRPITLCKAQDLLECDSEGNFEPAQCNTKFCFCVYFDTGNVREDTESIFYPENCPVLREDRTLCQIASYKSCPKRIRPGTTDISRDEGCEVLECREDDSFYPMYCSGDTCWCTDVNKGHEIEGTRGPKDSFHCNEQGEKLEYTGCERRRYDVCGLMFDRRQNRWIMEDECDEYQCDPADGLYVAKQCLGPNLCWCIDRYNGDVVQGSVSSNCSLQCHSNNTYTIAPCVKPTSCLDQNVMECDYTGEYFQFQVDENDVPICVYMDSGRYIPFSETGPEDCPRVRDNRGNCMVDYHESCTKTYNSNLGKYEYPLDCFRPKCASDERYVSRQCEGEICWCVDQDTGSRVPGTTGVSYQVECDPPRSDRCTDQYQLRCDGSYYKETQCTDRFCYCVYIDTGKLIWGSMTRGIANCTRQYDTRGHCRRAKEEACRMFYFDFPGTFGTLPGCEFDKECDRDGNFRKMECRGGTCMCTDPKTGEVRRSTAGPSGTFTCDEKGEKILIIIRDKTKCEVEGIEQCTPEGWYPTPDCDHGVCYCVYADSGAPIYGTEVPGAFPDCKEQFDDRSICRKHNERVCPHEYTEGRIVVPTSCPLVLECWDNGLFAPNQCRSDGMCFCVNVTTGDLIPGSFAERGKFACDEFGNIEVLPTNPPTSCQAQDQLTCDSFGNFLPRQCTKPVCFCVFMDSGRVVPDSFTTVLGATDQVCEELLDTRTECEIQRDEACMPVFNHTTYEFDRSEECYNVRCKSDGTFRAMQCLSRYSCHCVDTQSGELIPGSTTPIGELVCGQEICEGDQCSCFDERGRPMTHVSEPPCFFKLEAMRCPEKRKIHQRMGSRYVVQCDDDDLNKYSLMQCYRDVECWCVDPFNGTMIEGSMGPPDTVSCVYDPPCVRQQKAEIAAAVGVEGFFPVSMYSITQCEPDGEYYPRQCNVRTKECWCVDHETGVEIKGTRALPWVTDIQCVRILPPRSTQRRPKVTIQCPSNKPDVFCPENNCRRARCPSSPTAECVQHKCQSCGAVFYDPETLYPLSCLVNKLSCYYAGRHYRHGEEFDMGCSLTCFCYMGGLRCRPRCLLQNRPACLDPVIVQDPLDSCCKVYACRDKSFMNNSLSMFDDLKNRRKRDTGFDLLQLE